MHCDLAAADVYVLTCVWPHRRRAIKAVAAIRSRNSNIRFKFQGAVP